MIRRETTARHAELNAPPIAAASALFSDCRTTNLAVALAVELRAEVAGTPDWLKVIALRSARRAIDSGRSGAWAAMIGTSVINEWAR